MTELRLSASKRGTGKKGLSQLDDNQVPGVVYGREFASTPIEVNLLEVTKLFHTAGFNQVVDLQIDGKNQDILFKEVQADPVSGEIRHFDLYAVKKGEKIKAEVPVEMIGESQAVILGATIAVNVENVEVECVPAKLPEKFELDISSLKEIGDTLNIGDISTEEGVEILDDPEVTVFKVEEIKEMVVEEEVPEEEEELEGEEGEEEGEETAEGEAEEGESQPQE